MTLTKDGQLIVLNYVLRSLIDELETTGYSRGICWHVFRCIGMLFPYKSHDEIYIIESEMMAEIRKQALLFNAFDAINGMINHGFWWKRSDVVNRINTIKYCIKLINETP